MVFSFLALLVVLCVDFEFLFRFEYTSRGLFDVSGLVHEALFLSYE